MSRLHVFNIDFWRDWRNPVTPAPAPDDRKRRKESQSNWGEYRLDFMIQHTLQSLINQSSPSDVLIFVEPHYREQINTLLARRDPLPSQIRWYSMDLFQTLRDWYPEYDHYYITRVDSDDLFHKDAATEIKAIEPIYRTLIYQDGFVYDVPTKKIARYAHPSPPFYTDIFSREEVAKGETPKRGAHGRGLGGFKERLSSGKFVVLCHDQSMQCTTNFPAMKAIGMRNAHLVDKKVGFPEDDLSDFGCPYCVIDERI